MTSRAPKKYLDADRIEVNPDWKIWRDEQYEAAMDHLPVAMIGRGIDPTMYFPQLVDKAIPEEGCWILVLEEPFTELRSRFRVPLLSMWHCRPHTLSAGGIPVGVRSKATTVRAKQAVIATPGGNLHLWPHEYSVVDNPLGLISCEGAELHALGGAPVLDEEQLFYLRSRGIRYEDAVTLLIESIQNTDWGYVTFPEEVTAALEGVGQPLWRHIQRTPRGAASND